jgi:hypothetical protein
MGRENNMSNDNSRRIRKRLKRRARKRVSHVFMNI